MTRLGYTVMATGVLLFDRPIEHMHAEFEQGCLIRILVVTDRGVIGVPGSAMPQGLAG